jgi:hypothetical protein
MPETSQSFTRQLDVPIWPEIGDDFLPKNAVVHFHFGPHGNQNNLSGVEQLANDADIFILELPGWDEKAQKQLTAISKGDSKALQKTIESQTRFRGWKTGLLNLIYGTYKPILLVDVDKSANDELLAQFGTTQPDYFVGGNMEESLHKCADKMASSAEKAAIRDRIMVQNLGAKLATTITNHPKLRAKESVISLAPLGSTHFTIYDYLRQCSATKDKVLASSWAGSGPMVYHDEVTSLYAKGETPSRKLLLQTLGYMAFTSLRLRNGEELIDQYARYDSKQRIQNMIYEKAVDLVVEDEPAGHELILEILRSRPGHVHYDHEKVKKYVLKAGQLVAGVKL